MHTPTPAELDAMQQLLDTIVDEGVAVILETNTFAALHARLSTLFAPFAAMLVAADVDGQLEDDVLERVACALATHAAIAIWNTTPIPDNRFRPRKMAVPKHNTPCPCGSGRKFKQCCGLIDSPGLELAPEEMAARVLDRFPSARIGEIATFGVSVEILGEVAQGWLQVGRLADVIQLLTPAFADVQRLDRRAEMAADALLTAYLNSGDEAGRARLLDSLRAAPDKHLACIVHQRDATRAADQGDFPAAWLAFDAALKLTPDNPSLSNLEVLLLVTEGRMAEARARAEFWAAKLARDPEHDYSRLIETLHMMASPGGMRTLAEEMGGEWYDDDEAEDDDDESLDLPPHVVARLDALPQRYGERRLRVRVSLYDIEPPIWRELEVENTLSFSELHLVLQEAMGWQDCHLYQFEVGELRLGLPDEFIEGGFDADNLPADAVELGQLLGRRKSFDYVYDFGDDWRHRIVIEERLASTPLERPAALLDGARACPPEDCGGAWGYQRLLAILADKKNPEHKETRDWLGKWKPEAFKLATARKRVSTLFVPLW